MVEMEKRVIVRKAGVRWQVLVNRRAMWWPRHSGQRVKCRSVIRSTIVSFDMGLRCCAERFARYDLLEVQCDEGRRRFHMR